MKTAGFRKLLCLCSVVLVIAALLAESNPASAQLPPLPYAGFLIKAGKWLGQQAISYLTGKAIDKVVGVDYEKKLKEVETELTRRLNSGAENSQHLQAELAATRSQLKILQSLLSSRPTADDIEELRRPMARDLSNLQEVQAQQGQEIRNLESEVKALAGRVSRLEETEAGVPREPKLGPPPPPAPSRPWKTHSERAPPQESAEPPAKNPESVSGYELPPLESRRRARGQGVTLTIRITGQSNKIHVVETQINERADQGTFQVNGRRQQFTFRLLEGTGGVIDVQGDGNTIYLPSRLCRRVRLTPESRSSRVVGCK
jgi:hypothetical protein